MRPADPQRVHRGQNAFGQPLEAERIGRRRRTRHAFGINGDSAEVTAQRFQLVGENLVVLAIAGQQHDGVAAALLGIADAAKSGVGKA